MNGVLRLRSAGASLRSGRTGTMLVQPFVLSVAKRSRRTLISTVRPEPFDRLRTGGAKSKDADRSEFPQYSGRDDGCSRLFQLKKRWARGWPTTSRKSYPAVIRAPGSDAGISSPRRTCRGCWTWARPTSTSWNWRRMSSTRKTLPNGWRGPPREPA